jgi:hypothetical protein
MTADREFLLGDRASLETLDWFRAEFLPALIGEFNRPRMRRHLGLYSGERLPQNERNLTDVRNRVSLIVEYQLAAIGNQLLEKAGMTDLFWAYVVSNRFPDLEIRTSAGVRGLRFEVKCLQSVAEEKSANFDTLKKDIYPATDFLVVFIWEWDPAREDVEWDQAPKLIQSFAFHAASLAELRDYYWLNRPPAGLTGGYQGFDLRYAVNCRAGVYNEEEGNYGKLLRLWTNDTHYHLPMTPLLKRTLDDYSMFAQAVVRSGFETLVTTLLPRAAGATEVAQITNRAGLPAYRAGDTGFILAPGRSDALATEIMQTARLNRAYTFGEKYAWTEYRRAGNRIVKGVSGRKPKYLPFHPSAN